MFEGVDWEVVGVFAALVLLEGLRRIPAGALVVRAVGCSGWVPAADAESRGRWRLVSWCSPLVRSVVLPAQGQPGTISSDALALRIEVARRAAPWLAASGLLTMLSLVLGLPLATARLGAVGFLGAAAFVLALALLTAAAGALAIRRMNGSAGPLGRVLAWCSPFASGRVIEGVFQAAVEGASPAQVVRALSGERVFAAWARARAYDVVHGGRPDPDLLLAADVATLGAIVSAEPPLEPGGRSYCPRCAATWSLENGPCPGCAVPLVPHRA